jgi:hypothetical protein
LEWPVVIVLLAKASSAAVNAVQPFLANHLAKFIFKAQAIL